MRPAARVHQRVAALLFLAAVAGCEVLVDGKLAHVDCQAEGAVGPPACPEGSVCTGGVCVASDLGGGCTRDADCAPGDFCLDPADVGSEGARQCTRPCCASDDCDPDRRFVCWSAPTGAGSFCRLAADVDRVSGGSGKSGAPCTHDAACRSGTCSDGRCADTCCSDTPCTDEGQVCRFVPGPAGQAEGFRCAPPVADQKQRYQACSSDAECASGLCLQIVPDQTSRCTVPCCASDACGVTPDKGTPVACAPALVKGVWVRACSRLVTGQAMGEVGTPCHEGADCRSGACDASKRCTDTCCTDDGCGARGSFVCRPTADQVSWALLCTPK
jgi:hypothetical protein